MGFCIIDEHVLEYILFKPTGFACITPIASKSNPELEKGVGQGSFMMLPENQEIYVIRKQHQLHLVF